MPITLLAAPVTSSAMQKARNAATPRPARPALAPTSATSAAAAISPADDSAKDHGCPVHNGAPSAASSSKAKAPSSAAGPRPSVPTRAGKAIDKGTNHALQPTSDAAWLKNVAEGGRLKATRAGRATAMLANNGHCEVLTTAASRQGAAWGGG